MPLAPIIIGALVVAGLFGAGYAASETADLTQNLTTLATVALVGFGAYIVAREMKVI